MPVLRKYSTLAVILNKLFVSMKPKLLSLIYLSAVPFLTAILGFGIGHISYKLYLPIWIINVCLMGTASWYLGLNTIKNKNNEKKHQALGSFFLIIPWILVSIFFGFGPPPEKMTDWVATASEQQVRYSILVGAGIFIAFGFSSLRQQLKDSGEFFYSNLGLGAIMIAIPLFIINMIFWGFYLTESFKIFTAAGSEQIPDWFPPLRKQFGLISVVEVALTYLATASFTVSLRQIGWFNKTATRIYIAISLFAFLVIVLSAFLSEPFVTAGIAVSIPAIPFILPYFIGINLLRRLNK